MRNIIILLSLFFLINSCANLEEEVFDEVQVEDVQALLENPSPEFIDNLVASVYAPLVPIFSSQDYFGLQTTTSDVSMTPTRLWLDPSRSDWFNGGIFQRLHKHEWTPGEPLLNNTWNNLQQGIASALEILDAFNTPSALANPELTPRRAEVEGMLAFYMWATYDLFDQVPYIDIETG